MEISAEILSRLAELPTTPLRAGKHASIADGFCLLEAVSFVAREPWSDRPECACPRISTFLRVWHDALPDAERDSLLRPLIPLLINTRGSDALTNRRSMMAADWLVRTHTPAWLRLAGLTAHADRLAALPEIIDMRQFPSIRPAIEAARDDAAAARPAAWGAVWYAARCLATVEAGDAAADAASSNSGDVVAWAAAVDAAADAAGDPADDAAGDAADDAAWEALQTTRLELQQSALALVHRMIAARDAA